MTIYRLVDNKVYRITSEFGAMEPVREGQHTGIDLAMDVGTKLRSITNGVVIEIYDGSGSIGKGVRIVDGDGRSYIYGHMSKVTVKEEQYLQQGTLIGESGNTGNSTGPHLHFEVWENGVAIDPKEYKPLLDELSGNINPADLPWYDITGKVELAFENKMEELQQQMADAIVAFLKALAEVVLDLTYSFALIGGGILILVRVVAEMKKASQYFWLLQMSNILIKMLLGGVQSWQNAPLELP
ncbi:M23 family metallopeptidase [Sporosarcina jiandibaonis]|uniref:M23 family metallopeptidase n=1 Tax=Sporosarcina jiandibaonis TaxID=2715535 RepID=UPI0015535652|nr:M23 family metallopeptidase [Sporosarcina jiandibaonis]